MGERVVGERGIREYKGKEIVLKVIRIRKQIETYLYIVYLGMPKTKKRINRKPANQKYHENRQTTSKTFV